MEKAITKILNTVRIKSIPFTEFGITLVIGQAAKEEQKREARLYFGFFTRQYTSYHVIS